MFSRERTLNNKIDGFMTRKAGQYPELDLLDEAKTRDYSSISL
jgi:hypothetical protein